jgi:hypothetical protein
MAAGAAVVVIVLRLGLGVGRAAQKRQGESGRQKPVHGVFSGAPDRRVLTSHCRKPHELDLNVINFLRSGH